MPAWQDTLAALYSAVPGPPVSSASAPLVAAGGLVWMPPATPTNDGYMTAAQAASVGGIVTEASVRAALAASAGAVAVHSQKVTGLVAGAAPGEAVEFSQLAGIGSPARFIPLDGNDVIEWKMEEASPVWANTGNGGALALTPVTAASVFVGGSPLGTNCLHAGDINGGAKTPMTTIGQNASGTIHGWVQRGKLFGSAGDVIAYKGEFGGPVRLTYAGDMSASVYDRFGALVAATAIEVSASQDDSYLWMLRTEWSHVALTWSAGVANIYVNGVTATAGLAYTEPLSWSNNEWYIGEGYGHKTPALFWRWRICDVARSQAYLREVYSRVKGMWP